MKKARQTVLSPLAGRRAGECGFYSVTSATFTAFPGCEVTTVLCTEQATVNLPGSRVLEPRAGWVTLEVPPLEDWNPELQKLSHQDRLKVESAQFHEERRVRVTRRFLALRSRPGPG